MRTRTSSRRTTSGQRARPTTIKNNGGYLSQACSAAEILATLYEGLMYLGPSEGPMVPPPFPRTSMLACAIACSLLKTLSWLTLVAVVLTTNGARIRSWER